MDIKDVEEDGERIHGNGKVKVMYNFLINFSYMDDV